MNHPSPAGRDVAAVSSSTFTATTVVVWWSLIQSTPRRGQGTALKKHFPLQYALPDSKISPGRADARDQPRVIALPFRGVERRWALRLGVGLLGCGLDWTDVERRWAVGAVVDTQARSGFICGNRPSSRPPRSIWQKANDNRRKPGNSLVNSSSTGGSSDC